MVEKKKNRENGVCVHRANFLVFNVDAWIASLLTRGTYKYMESTSQRIECTMIDLWTARSWIFFCSILKLKTKWTNENCLGFGSATTIEKRRREGANAMQVRNKKNAGKCKRNTVSIEMVDDFRFMSNVTENYFCASKLANDWMRGIFKFTLCSIRILLSLSLSHSIVVYLLFLWLRLSFACSFTLVCFSGSVAPRTHILFGETSWDPSITIDFHSW